MVAIRVANELEQQALLSADRRFFTEPHYDGYPGGAGSPRSRHRLRARAVDPRSMAMSCTEAVVGRNAVSDEEPAGSRPAVSAKPAPKKRPVKAARDANHGEAREAKIDAAAFATSRCALCVLCVPSSEQMLRPCGLPTIRRMWARSPSADPDSCSASTGRCGCLAASTRPASRCSPSRCPGCRCRSRRTPRRPSVQRGLRRAQRLPIL